MMRAMDEVGCRFSGVGSVGIGQDDSGRTMNVVEST